MPDVVALLTGPEAADVLQSALTGAPGAQLPRFTCTVDEVHDRVGAETSVTYHVSYGEGADARQDYLVVTTADKAWTAQFEHTVVVTEDGYEILTLPSGS